MGTQTQMAKLPEQKTTSETCQSAGKTLTERWLEAIDNEEDCFPEAYVDVSMSSPAAEYANDPEGYEKSFAKGVRRLQNSL